MCNHECPVNPDLTAPPPDLDAAMNDGVIQFGDEPARASIGTHGDVLVDKKFWESIDPPARRFLIHHEFAHKQRGGCAGSCGVHPRGCERCADARAGAAMAGDGFTLKQTLDAVNRLSFRNRQTAPMDAVYGWNAYTSKGGNNNHADYRPKARLLSERSPGTASMYPPPKIGAAMISKGVNNGGSGRPPTQSTRPPVAPPSQPTVEPPPMLGGIKTPPIDGGGLNPPKKDPSKPPATTVSDPTLGGVKIPPIQDPSKGPSDSPLPEAPIGCPDWSFIVGYAGAAVLVSLTVYSLLGDTKLQVAA